MKDKLRELAERWRNFGSPYDAYAMGVNKCAAELLTILDAAWKAGEASWRRSVEHCTCQACQITHASDCAVHNMPAMPTGPCDCGAIHPARSGVASDEDVSVVAKMIADRVGNGMREKYEGLAKQIAEHFTRRTP